DDFLEKLHFWIKMINKNKQKYTEIYERDDKYYLVVGDCIRKGKRIKGHSFMITDNTDEIKYQKIIEDYNKSLKDEVDKKTHEIMHINDVFGKNVSPQIRDYLLKGNVKLGGENCNITIMFCDIRSFTTLSENMPSEKIVKMLNFYFTQLEKCISAHNGVINKYMGDAIMALFGAPMPSKTHQMDAFAAALDMRRTLKEINKQFKAKGYPELQFGIGIHSGPVLAGNIGALNRMEYTVIGDAVNAASRIEGLCKTYKKDLLMSEDTALEIMTANPQLVLEFVDFTELRGRKEKVRLFTD
nr:adenylate/guanylate cyclase domain-containing protein [Treponema sp.]